MPQPKTLPKQVRAISIRVTGLVQGVSFRHNTRKLARRLGLRGFVKNMPDGSVHAEVSGASDALKKLARWCEHGPASARVKECQVTALDPAKLKGESQFEIRY